MAYVFLCSNVTLLSSGTSLAPIVSAVGGARGSNGEGMPREHRNGSGPRDSGARVLPVRNVIAATMPTSQTGIAISGVSQPGLSASQPPSDSSLSSIVSELNSHIRNFVGNMQGEDAVQSGTLLYALWILVDT